MLNEALNKLRRNPNEPSLLDPNEYAIAGPSNTFSLANQPLLAPMPTTQPVLTPVKQHTSGPSLVSNQTLLHSAEKRSATDSQLPPPGSGSLPPKRPKTFTSTSSGTFKNVHSNASRSGSSGSGSSSNNNSSRTSIGGSNVQCALCVREAFLLKNSSNSNNTNSSNNGSNGSSSSGDCPACSKQTPPAPPPVTITPETDPPFFEIHERLRELYALMYINDQKNAKQEPRVS